MTHAPPPTPPGRKPEAGRRLKAPRAPSKPPHAPGDPDPGDATALPMPHERDESVLNVSEQVNPVIDQAYKDLEAGQVDTDLRATPGLDVARREKMVRGGGR